MKNNVLFSTYRRSRAMATPMPRLAALAVRLLSAPPSARKAA
jgi:hypothetical protein